MKKIIVLAVLTLLIMGCSNKTSSNKIDTQKTNTDLKTSTNQKVKPKVNPGMVILTKDKKIDWKKEYPTDEKRISYIKNFTGKKAPDFTLTNLKGETVQLSAIKKNKLFIIVNTTSMSSVYNFPYIEEFQKKNPKVEVLIVFPDDTTEAVKNFFKKNKFKYNEKAIAGNRNNTIMSDYRVMFQPLFFYIDKNNVIKYIYFGRADAKILQNKSKYAFKK